METYVCPFINVNGTLVLCNNGRVELPNNTKDIIRQQMKGQIIDFDTLTPRELCRAWDAENKCCIRLTTGGV